MGVLLTLISYTIFVDNKKTQTDLHTFCDAEALKIQGCRDQGNFLDVEEDVTNSINCTDITDNDNITWTITKDEVSTEVATCTPSGCTNHSSDVAAVREAGNKTQLLYPSRDRGQDQGTSVSCTSNKSQNGQLTTSCKLNVISMACLHLLVMCTFLCACVRQYLHAWLVLFICFVCMLLFLTLIQPPWLSGRSILMLLFVCVCHTFPPISCSLRPLCE